MRADPKMVTLAQEIVRNSRRCANRYPTTVTDLKRQGKPVATLMQVDDLGNFRSGGAPKQRYSDARGPDASRLLWAFTARQFGRCAQTPRVPFGVPAP